MEFNYKYCKPKSIFINESQFRLLKEDVFVSKLKGKKAQLSYNKRKSANPTKNFGNYSTNDMLNTGKMDQNDADTYIVPLKGGINSYNITSIKGTEVMHYFKRKFDKQKTMINIKVNGENNEFELYMNDPEFQEFMQQFITKVSIVLNYVTNELAAKDKDFQGFRGVSIYPVKSSSNFNKTMAQILEAAHMNINGLPCRAINTTLFDKDMSDLQKDTDFINKNRDYYNSEFAKNASDTRTHMDVVNDTIRKYKNTTAAQDETLINNYNHLIKEITNQYYIFNRNPENIRVIKRIVDYYQQLIQAKQAIRQKLGKGLWDNAFKNIKYAKSPQVQKRTVAIQNLVQQYRQRGDRFIPIDIVEISPLQFQIKNLSNDVRMGLKNFFALQKGTEEELAKIEGTVFVIFDDNVSGGSTLSEICSQAQKAGIKYLVPITFGEMREKYQQGTLCINAPEKWNF